MTGGSSAARREDRRQPQLGDQLGYTSVKNVLWGPYFGTVIQSVYSAAAATP